MPQQPPVTDYFTGLASVYADYRPSYPMQAIDVILRGLPRPVRVADVGCGTGISSRLLAAAGAAVIGVDPNVDMMAEARKEGSPQGTAIQYRQGTGERTGLDSGSVDLVVCAQSFHWFDAPAALAEFHRVVRPGGRLALVWNVRDPSDPFTARYCRVSDQAQADARHRGLVTHTIRSGDPTVGGFFINAQRFDVPNPQPADWPGALGRIRSASYFPRGGPLRDELEEELRQAFDSHQRDGRVVIMHITEITLTDRNDSI